MRAMAYAGTILIGYFAMKSELPPPPPVRNEVRKPGTGKRNHRYIRSDLSYSVCASCFFSSVPARNSTRGV